jgi:hypothetical protein
VGTSFEKGCRGIVSEALHAYILKHFDEVWEQSKALFSAEGKAAAKAAAKKKGSK